MKHGIIASILKLFRKAVVTLLDAIGLKSAINGLITASNDLGYSGKVIAKCIIVLRYPMAFA